MMAPRISYASGSDGVSLAFTVAGDGPALIFVPWVPFSNLRKEWQNPVLNKVFDQLARRLTLVHYDGRERGIRSGTSPIFRWGRWCQTLKPLLSEPTWARSVCWGSTTPARTPSPTPHATRRKSSGWCCLLAPPAAGTR
jgi:hypothetical protein